MVQPAEMALLFPGNAHMLKYKKGRRNSGFAECVCGVFGCAGGDRQAREGSRRFDPIHFSLHVCINIYIYIEREM